MKVRVVGSGMVGGAAACAIGLRGVTAKVVPIDHFPKRAESHALDIAHAMPFGSARWSPAATAPPWRARGW